MGRKPKKLSKSTILDRLRQGLEEINCSDKKEQAYGIFCTFYKGEHKYYLGARLSTVRKMARLHHANKRMLAKAEQKVK
jgi:hypothetical protein